MSAINTNMTFNFTEAYDNEIQVSVAENQPANSYLQVFAILRSCGAQDKASAGAVPIWSRLYGKSPISFVSCLRAGAILRIQKSPWPRSRNKGTRLASHRRRQTVVFWSLAPLASDQPREPCLH